MKEQILLLLENTKYAMTKEEIEEALQVEVSDQVLKELFMDYMIVETKTHKYMPYNRGLLKKGQIKMLKDGSGIFEYEGNSFKVLKDDTKFAITGDTVIVQPNYNKNDSSKNTAVVYEVLSRNTIEIIGEVIVNNGHKYIKPMDNNLRKLIIKIDDEIVNMGDLVRVELDKNSFDEKVDCNLIKIIANKADNDSDIKLVLEEFGIEENFPDEVMEEVRKLPTEVTPEEKKLYMDLTNEEIFTIDGDDTKDIDDAVGCRKLENGNYLLTVSIAYVAYYVKFGSAIFKEALKRGNSVYFLNSSIPELPRELSNGICSLNPGVDRLAMTSFMEIDKNGKVVNFKEVESVINSKKQMTYKNVNKILAGEEVLGYEQYKKSLLTMKELSDILENQRLLRGSLDFDQDELKVIVDENNKPIELTRKEKGSAQKMIETFMVFKGETIANRMSMKNIPFAFRIHATPKAENIKNFISLLRNMGYEYNDKTVFENPLYLQNILKYICNLPEANVLKIQFLRCLPKAVYDTVNVGHTGLASEKYTQITSPIRRILDLVIQYMIYDFEIKKDFRPAVIDKYNELEAIAMHATTTERRADKIERKITNMKAIQYMGEHLNESFKGTINSVEDKCIYVTLDNLVEGSINFSDLNDYYKYDARKNCLVGQNTGDILMVGDRLLLNIAYINKHSGTLNFKIASKLKSVKMNIVVNKAVQKVKKRKNSDYQK